MGRGRRYPRLVVCESWSRVGISPLQPLSCIVLQNADSSSSSSNRRLVFRDDNERPVSSSEFLTNSPFDMHTVCAHVLLSSGCSVRAGPWRSRGRLQRLREELVRYRGCGRSDDDAHQRHRASRDAFGGVRHRPSSALSSLMFRGLRVKRVDSLFTR